MTELPWSIKLMPMEERNAALAAAKRRKMPVGEWLALAIRTQIQTERNGNKLPAKISRRTIGEGLTLGEVERLVSMARDVAGASNMALPKGVQSLAFRYFRERMLHGAGTSDSERIAGEAESPPPGERAPVVPRWAVEGVGESDGDTGAGTVPDDETEGSAGGRAVNEVS